MKKRILPFFVALCLVFTTAVVPAFAYTETATASITKSGTKVIFKGTTKTNATGSLVSFIQTNMYVNNFMSGKVYFDVYGTDSKVAYLSLSRITDAENAWYCNTVDGVVQYYGDSTKYLAHAYKELKLTSAASLYRTTTQQSLSEFHKIVRDDILSSFDYNPQDYTFYLDTDLSDILSTDQCTSIRHQLGLEFEDTIPGYYMDASQGTIIAVNQNSVGENQIFVFNATSDGNWVLVS